MWGQRLSTARTTPSSANRATVWPPTLTTTQPWSSTAASLLDVAVIAIADSVRPSRRGRLGHWAEPCLGRWLVAFMSPWPLAFASPPAPPAALHLGGAMTALLNRLFARAHGGSCCCGSTTPTTSRGRWPAPRRRSSSDLRWLGIGWDEGPVRQSDRAARYAEAASQADGAIVRDGAVRLASPGAPEFVILRSDGSATYHWATAVDDLDFGITDVIRGNDHLSQHAAARRRDPVAGRRAAAAICTTRCCSTADEGKLSKRDDAASIARAARGRRTRRRRSPTCSGCSAAPGPGDVLTLDELAERFDEDRLARGTVELDPARVCGRCPPACCGGCRRDELVAAGAAVRPAGNAPRIRSPRWSRRCAACIRWPRPATWWRAVVRPPERHSAAGAGRRSAAATPTG